jgi:hypothetical protein
MERPRTQDGRGVGSGKEEARRRETWPRFFSTAGPHRHERGITVGECCSQREGDLEVRYPTTRGMGEAAADLGPWEGRKNIRRGNIKVQREKEGGGKTLLQCTGCGWSVYKTKKARGAQC